MIGIGDPAFDRYIGIDYSGAKTLTSSLPGLRVYLADHASPPSEVLPTAQPSQILDQERHCRMAGR